MAWRLVIPGWGVAARGVRIGWGVARLINRASLFRLVALLSW